MSECGGQQGSSCICRGGVVGGEEGRTGGRCGGRRHRDASGGGWEGERERGVGRVVEGRQVVRHGGGVKEGMRRPEASVVVMVAMRVVRVKWVRQERVATVRR